jgi:outer membrane protein OmpA-like peptidoglycan-associated protein
MLPLRVLSPCEVPAWELEAGDGALHCRRCQTAVHDLTAVSEARARALGLLHGSRERFCGRMRVDARGDGIFRSDARALTALAFAAAMSTSCAAVEPAPAVTEEPTAARRPLSHRVTPTPPPTSSAVDEPRRVVVSSTTGMIILQPVRFDSHRAIIGEEDKSTLNEIAKLLAENPNVERVEVEGHADANEPLPELIGKRRADAVVDHLIGIGVAAERLVATSAGNKKPIETNATSEGRAKNRRIQFNIVPAP